jgi:hypothetical protein
MLKGEIMKLNTLFVINTVVAVQFGLGFILIPSQLLSLYDFDINAVGIYLTRLLWAAFLAFAIISWLVRGSVSSHDQRTVVMAFLIADILNFIVSLIYQFQAIANAIGWSTSVIYLLLGLGFGYFYFRIPTST